MEKTKTNKKNCSRANAKTLYKQDWEQIQEGRKMKKTAQIAVIGALLTVGIAQSYAQSNATVVAQLNVALSGFSGDSSTATPVRISNKDIISALNTAGNSFSKSAKLLIETPAAGGSPSFIVRDGGTDTDVSDSFGTDSTDTIGNGKQQYQIFSLQFDAGTGTSFSVSGFATEHLGTVKGKDTGALTDQVTSLSASVSGTGDVAGNGAVLKGTVTAGGAKGELH